MKLKIDGKIADVVYTRTDLFGIPTDNFFINGQWIGEPKTNESKMRCCLCRAFIRNKRKGVGTMPPIKVSKYVTKSEFIFCRDCFNKVEILAKTAGSQVRK